MGSVTWGGLLAVALPAAIGLLSNVLGIWLGRRPQRSGERVRSPFRLHIIDRWGWASIAMVILTALMVACLAGTAVGWIAGAITVTGYAVAVTWWGWRRMPLLTREAGTWLRSWQSENDGQGGLSYREELTGLAERIYTVQDLSRVTDLPAAGTREAARGEVLSPDDLLSTGMHVLVTGEAGVGKSTNLRHFGSASAQRFWIEATRRSASGTVPQWLPVLLSARDLAGRTSIAASLGSAPQEMLTRAPARGAKWLVLVDAVDEVLNADQRQQVWGLLLEAVRTEGPFRLVISSRSVDSTRWRDLPMRRVDLYEHSIEQWLNKFDDALENQVLHGVPKSERDDVHKLLNRLEQWHPVAAKRGRAAVMRGFLTRLASMITFDEKLDLVGVAAFLMGDDAVSSFPAKRLAVGRVLEATGLIRDPYHDARFWHQTFAEYLAAPIRVAQGGNDPQAWGQHVDDPSFWTERLADTATRPGMIFAFHHLSKDRRYQVIRALTDSLTHLRRAAILVAEGLCDAVAHDLLCDELWRCEPGPVPDSPHGRRAYATWWDVAAVLSDRPRMKWRLRSLGDTATIWFGDRVNALAVLAKGGDEDCLERLETLVRDLGSRPCHGRRDVLDRAYLVDALATVDVERGVDALVAMAGGTSLSTRDGGNLLQAVARIDAERWSAKLLAVAGDASVELTVRLNLAEALARADDGRGLKLMAAMSCDAEFSKENRNIVAIRLANTFMACPKSVRDALEHSDIDRVIETLRMDADEVPWKAFTVVNPSR